VQHMTLPQTASALPRSASVNMVLALREMRALRTVRPVACTAREVFTSRIATTCARQTSAHADMVLLPVTMLAMYTVRRNVLRARLVTSSLWVRANRSNSAKQPNSRRLLVVPPKIAVAALWPFVRIHSGSASQQHRRRTVFARRSGPARCRSGNASPAQTHRTALAQT
jgi:hypothetical protein